VVKVTVDIGPDEEETLGWKTALTLSDFATLCCEPHIDLLSDRTSFSVTHRMRGFGPLTVAELIVGSDLSLDCGEWCGAYRVNLMHSGRLEAMHHSLSVTAGAGDAIVYRPEGDTAVRWASGSHMLSVNIDRDFVDDAFSRALGRPVVSQVDLRPAMRTTTVAARAWINMLAQFTEQLFCPGSVLTTPMVGLPFVDSIVHGLLLVADHSHRDTIAAEPKPIAPQRIRTVIDTIEAEAQRPLTLSALAARSGVSARNLQKGFQRHMGISPMAYLRQVRLRRAHQALREGDPSTDTVASIAYQWGYIHPGRFAADHIARYGEAPSVTLRRNVFHHRGIRSTAVDKHHRPNSAAG